MNLILCKDKYILGRIGLYYGGIWGEAELILRIWRAKEKYFQGAEEFSSGIWGDQCIIFRDQGSTDPPGASYRHVCWETDTNTFKQTKKQQHNHINQSWTQAILETTVVLLWRLFI